ncbi:MAG: RecQ family ATP-dependent DNA helicase [Muribaculum sp.]|nr:RecQ family ATP-dependent DNA helicase [Muribaculum sp.]
MCRIDIHDILNRHWGYTEFRPMQEEIITSILAGRDTLGLLPTGGGKSITFQVPAMALGGLTVVVTPLISLMKDQVDNLRAAGIRAVCLHSGLTRAEHKLGLDRCRLGKAKLLYLSPEKLQSKNFVDQLRGMNISLIVVDEAHCISQWGYDFRPSYLRINTLRGMFPYAPILALTASATPEVVTDIMDKLQFKQPNVYSRSFARDNISYIVRHDNEKDRQLLKILLATHGSAIVYVRSRLRTREIADLLKKHGISADYYHAGLAPEDKSEKQERWKNEDIRVIVATNAFGMGIDKPDVRTVVHIDPPSSLEEYYQEAGRAGRDGKPSFAVLIVSTYDKGRLSRMVDEAFPPKEFIRRVYELAGNFAEVAVGEGYGHLYEFNFPVFLQTYKLPPRPTRSALQILTQAEQFEFMEEVSTQSRVMMTVDRSELYSLHLDEKTECLLNGLLRSYTGLFADFVYINETVIASFTSLTEKEVYESLLILSRMHVLQYIPRKSTPYLYYTYSRQLPKHVDIPRAAYEIQRLRLQKRVDAMKQFAFSDTECRVNRMLRYFGENPERPCGKCDVCRSRRPAAPYTNELRQNLKESILYMVGQAPRSIEYIVHESAYDKENIVKATRELLYSGKLKLDSSGRLIIK